MKNYLKNLKEKIHLNKISVFFLVVVLSAAVTLGIYGLMRVRAYTSPSKPNLASADSFAVLAGTAITDSNPSIITGNVGLYPGGGAFITGLACTSVTGTVYDKDAGYAGITCLITSSTLLNTAQSDLTAAYNAAASSTPDITITADLGTFLGGTLAPGVYYSGSSIAITGTTTLDAGGDADAVFIFQAGSTLTTLSGSHVNLINGAQACNVFWQVGSDATIGTYSNFKGNILALGSITDAGHSTINGRLLSRNAAVTLDYTNLTKATCAVATPPSLQLLKTVTNDNGGTATNTDWILTATGATSSPTNLSGTSTIISTSSFKVDTYTLSEAGGPAGYTSNTYSCVKNGVTTVSNVISLVNGDVAICTINNDDNPAHLIVVKTVVNDNVGISTSSDFSTTITGVSTAVPTAVGVGSPGVDNVLTTVGAYSVDEGAHVGYDKTLSADCSSTIALGETKTCTITNDDIAPQALHLRKVVINNSGGIAIDTDWTLTAVGATGTPTNLSGTTPVDSDPTFKADTYTLAETGGPSGYASSSWVCVGGTQSNSSTIIIGAGENATCTITNDDIAPQLTVTKFVNNNHGGTKVVADFPLFIDGQSVTSGVASTTSAGLHTISETSDPGYTSVISGDCSSTGTINLALGDVKSCTITNSDIAPQLTVTKFVNNNHGGTKVVADFPLFIDGLSITSGVATTTLAGLHTISETSDPGYTAVIGGDCSSTGTINIAPGGTAACTITNSDIAPQLTVTKFVVGGTKVPADFPLFIDGYSVTSGIASTTLSGSHTISETSDSNYTAVIGGDCSAAGTINLALGAVKVCTITNSYIAPPSGGGGSSYVSPVPPIIDVVKVPSPLALPGGAGPVTYTYTLRNIGIVPVVNVTMVDDSCSSTSYISGDTNNDSKLGVKEIWTYKCSTTLAKTHTNSVVATGWANGLSATDIANATVVVGASIIPPLIHVTKIPNPLTLTSKGGMVTYTEKITNPGIVALSNVHLTDDKCGPVIYISGDTNGDSKLDTSETWMYTCRTDITQTTTNTATASGEANGLTARDFAFATVVVAPASAALAVPGLPNTGINPDENNSLWYVIASAFTSAFIYIKMKKFLK